MTKGIDVGFVSLPGIDVGFSARPAGCVRSLPGEVPGSAPPTAAGSLTTFDWLPGNAPEDDDTSEAPTSRCG